MNGGRCTVLFRREPRGSVKVDGRMIAANRLYVGGASQAELAAMYGVSIGAIRSWLEKVREWKRDEPARAALARGKGE